MMRFGLSPRGSRLGRAIAQAFLAAHLIRRYCRGIGPFERTRDVFCFVGTQAIACLISATFGVLALCVGGVALWKSYGYMWLTWYLGDGVGTILLCHSCSRPAPSDP